MTTNQTLIIRRGSRYIDLTADPYSIGRDFIVPTIAPGVGFASGSSANINGGSIRTSIKYGSRAWSFEIKIIDTSDSAIRLAARAVSQFLFDINDSEKTYIEWRGNSDTPEPIYGVYGTAFRYEVIDGMVSVWPEYYELDYRGKASFITLDLTIAPFAESTRIRAFNATGGVIEDKYGLTDGRSRGLIVAEATTNKHTNPIFGNATWDNAWTTGANIVSSDNTDTRWLLPGQDHSAKLANVSAFTELFTQSINAGNTNKHSMSCYARLPDGGAVSATQVSLYYNTTLTTVYTAVGNGWYRLTSDNFDGINAATDTGVIVASRKVVYVAFFQIEEKAYSTPACHGDMIGCAWTGTIHASTSTRTVSTCKITTAVDTFKHGAWSARAIIKTHFAYNHSDSWFIFDARDGSNANAPYLIFDSSGVFYAAYGGQSSTSASQTFGRGSTYVLHVVCSGSNITLYTNGVAGATSTAFNPVVFGANLFLGSSYSAAQHGNHTLMGWSTFDTALTAAQVTADYTNVAAVVANDTRVGSIPYLWTLGGDAVLALTASHQPLGIVDGVPGTAPAITEIQGVLSSNWSTIQSIAINNFPCDAYLGNIFLFDMSTSAAAGDYGGEHKTTTIDGALLLMATGTISKRYIKYLDGVEYMVVSRLYGSAATQFTLFSYYVFNGGSFGSDGRPVTPSTSYRMIRTMAQILDTHSGEFVGNDTSDVTMQLYGSKVATNVDVSVDYYAVLPDDVIFLVGGDMANANFFYKGMTAVQASAPSGRSTGSKPLNTTGRVIEFAPGKVNHLQCYFCPDEAVDPAITYTATFSTIYLTPRWALL